MFWYVFKYNEENDDNRDNEHNDDNFRHDDKNRLRELFKKLRREKLRPKNTRGGGGQ